MSDGLLPVDCQLGLLLGVATGLLRSLATLVASSCDRLLVEYTMKGRRNLADLVEFIYQVRGESLQTY